VLPFACTSCLPSPASELNEAQMIRHGRFRKPFATTGSRAGPNRGQRLPDLLGACCHVHSVGSGDGRRLVAVMWMPSRGEGL
jgi:hypothetical protein